jgi:hypothetical protein
MVRLKATQITACLGHASVTMHTADTKKLTENDHSPFTWKAYKGWGDHDETIEYPVTGEVGVKRYRVEITLDFITKDVADCYATTLRGTERIQTWHDTVMLFPDLDRLLCIEIRHTLCGLVRVQSGCAASVTDPGTPTYCTYMNPSTILFGL